MNPKTGIWIDHKKAVIVTITDKGEKIIEIQSNVEKQQGRFNGKRSLAPFEPRLVPADDKRQRRFTGQLNKYYQTVIGSIRNAESMLIFGPKEARLELKKHLEKNHLGGHVVEIEPADAMTKRQIVAKVKKYFKININKE